MTSRRHQHGPTMRRDACGASTGFGNGSMPSTDQAGKAKSRPDPSVGDMGMAWTRSGNVSKFFDSLDTFPEHVRRVNMFASERHTQLADLSACEAQAESAKLEQAIKANLRGLGYGG